jgi:hypothetical protein
MKIEATNNQAIALVILKKAKKNNGILTNAAKSFLKTHL